MPGANSLVPVRFQWIGENGLATDGDIYRHLNIAIRKTISSKKNCATRMLLRTFYPPYTLGKMGTDIDDSRLWEVDASKPRIKPSQASAKHGMTM